MTPDLSKDLWRAAELIHVHASRRRPCQNNTVLPVNAWSELSRLERRRQRAIQHGWHRAASKLIAEIVADVESLQLDLEELAGKLRATPPAPTSVAEIYRDLVSLRQEFSDLTVCFEEEELSATTAPVVFKQLHLGEFEIRLNWTRIGQPCSYRVVALNPSPARSNSGVTHPHVSDEQLCEGDGQAAIRAALMTLRLADFFLLVSRLLATYAPGRAYVELDEWLGDPCHGCGAGVDSDDRYYCQRCDEVLCNDCVEYCSFCEEGQCNGCLEVCSGCDLPLCSSCLDACSACGESYCPNCLDQERCANCDAKDDLPAEPAQATDALPPAAADAAIQPDCLGEALVST
jgi:hypothetical protein